MHQQQRSTHVPRGLQVPSVCLRFTLYLHHPHMDTVTWRGLKLGDVILDGIHP